MTLSTALALAVVLTASSTPAFAAKSNNGDTKPPPTVEATDKKPKFEQVKPGAAVDLLNTNQQPGFKPDVRVVFVNSTPNGNGRHYLFRVESRGVETDHNIGLSSRVSHKSDTSNVTKYVYGGHGPIGPLATGQSQDVMIACDPQPGFSCLSATLEAEVTNDLNPDDNRGHS